MNGQERSRGFKSVTFEVSPDTLLKVTRLIDRDPERFIDEGVEMIQREDSILWMVLTTVARFEASEEEQGDFIYGGVYVFRSIREQGIEVPAVNLDTVEAFIGELESFQKVFEDLPEGTEETLRGKEVIAERLRGLELTTVFDPSNRAKENAPLMVNIAAFGINSDDCTLNAWGRGAMFTYEIIRRSWLSALLGKQLKNFGLGNRQ